MKIDNKNCSPWIERLNYACVESVGRRTRQEDYHLFSPDHPSTQERGLLAVLADGMGGHAGGAEASRMVVECFAKNFSKRDKSRSISAVFESVVDDCNGEIARAQTTHPEFGDMGCTLVALYVQDKQFQWVSVGDSPLFLHRQGRLIRLNEDHSMAPLINDAVEKGLLSEEDAKNHSSRNVLRSAIMGDPIEMTDLSSTKSLVDGDALILASDGILTLSLEEMEELLACFPRDAKVQADRLLDAVIAKEVTWQDNITIMVVVF